MKELYNEPSFQVVRIKQNDTVLTSPQGGLEEYGKVF